MSMTENVLTIQNEIKKICQKNGRDPKEVTIVGVTKYVDLTVAKALVQSGIHHLGENRPDPFLEKYQTLASGVKWHFIGTLQTRKVKEVVHQLDYLHSLDRLSLVEEINKRAEKPVKCFVQVNTSGEESKHGLAKEEVLDFVKSVVNYDKIQIVGLMTMAPHTEDEGIIRACFRELRLLRDEVRGLNLPYAPCTELSMGMSNDYHLAIEEGATFVRLGRVLTDVKES